MVPISTSTILFFISILSHNFKILDLDIDVKKLFFLISVILQSCIHGAIHRPQFIMQWVLFLKVRNDGRRGTAANGQFYVQSIKGCDGGIYSLV